MSSLFGKPTYGQASKYFYDLYLKIKNASYVHKHREAFSHRKTFCIKELDNLNDSVTQWHHILECQTSNVDTARANGIYTKFAT